VTHFFPSSLDKRYVFGVIQKYLQLTFTVNSDPELDFLKENCVISADCSTLDSLPPVLSCTEIFVRGKTDLSAINSYGYI
jgi:hypothetical protein